MFRRTFLGIQNILIQITGIGKPEYLPTRRRQQWRPNPKQILVHRSSGKYQSVPIQRPILVKDQAAEIKQTESETAQPGNNDTELAA